MSANAAGAYKIQVAHVCPTRNISGGLDNGNDGGVVVQVLGDIDVHRVLDDRYIIQKSNQEPGLQITYKSLTE